MVVIETEENEETVAEQIPLSPKSASTTTSSSSRSKTTDSSNDNTRTTATATVNGNDSDGFETASEREVSDEEEDDKKEANNSSSNQDQQQQQEDAENDDESKQRRLAEANEAKLGGNKLFGEGKYEEAIMQYEVALQVAPPPDMPSSTELRSICHSNRATCFFKLGKHEDTIKECTKALELNPSYMKALARRGEADEKLEHFEEAIADMKKILELDPSNDQARKAIRRLEPLAAEKREKMKEEMIAKLKEVGNSILGRFGMSVDNFKAVKDPNTGSYSINFQQ